MKAKVLIISLILLILLLITACSSVPPQNTIQNFFQALQQQKIEEAAKYVSGNKAPITYESEEQKQIIQSYINKLKCEVISSEVKGNEATIKVKIISPDLLRIATKAMSELLPMAFASAFSDNQSSNEEMNKMALQYFLNSLNDPNVPTTVTETDIKLVKDKGQWLIQPTDDFTNALTGNIGKAFGMMENKK